MKVRITLDLHEVTRVTTSLHFMALPKAISCKRCNRRTRVRIDVTAGCQPKSSNIEGRNRVWCVRYPRSKVASRPC